MIGRSSDFYIRGILSQISINTLGMVADKYDEMLFVFGGHYDICGTRKDTVSGLVVPLRVHVSPNALEVYESFGFPSAKIIRFEDIGEMNFFLKLCQCRFYQDIIYRIWPHNLCKRDLLAHLC